MPQLGISQNFLPSVENFVYPKTLYEIRLLIYYEYENSKESKDILENYSNIPNLSLV